MLQIDRRSSRPAYVQIVDELSDMILTGTLGPNEQIPSVRTLAIDLAINPNTIQKAYGLLERAGITYTQPGVGRFVAPDARDAIARSRAGRLNELRPLLTDLAQAGVPRTQVDAVVREVYKEKEDGHDSSK
ncbi:MAG: GntR family transcriptional regulator [Actinomycetes bacterium]|jgi:GntR family transcriptional regulator|nr:GntR family transcriptional regulator [Actinomycetes bacterium]